MSIIIIKVAIISIFTLTVKQMTMSKCVEEVAQPTQDYYSNLKFPSAL